MVRGTKREAILARGLDLLYLHGFGGTGVKDITAAAGVPKGSFYNYFDSKAEFGIECLREYEEYWIQELEGALVESEQPPLERLRLWYRRSIEDVLEHGYSRGCFAGNLAQELGDADPQFHLELDRVFNRFQLYIVRCLEEARAAGEIAPESDATELASFIMNSWQGALLRLKASGTGQPLWIFDRMIFERLLSSS